VLRRSRTAPENAPFPDAGIESHDSHELWLFAFTDPVFSDSAAQPIGATAMSSNEIPDLPASSLSMPNPHDDGPLFPLGQVVATPGALEHCAKNNVSPLSLISQHSRGRWGDLVKDDKIANENALFSGGRILSAYRVADEKLYVITEWDRSITTLLLAREY